MCNCNSNNSSTSCYGCSVIPPSVQDGLQGPQGPKGDKGDTGDTGPQGPTGATGAPGPAGADGVDGINGVDGVVILDTLLTSTSSTNLAWYSLHTYTLLANTMADNDFLDIDVQLRCVSPLDSDTGDITAGFRMLLDGGVQLRNHASTSLGLNELLGMTALSAGVFATYHVNIKIFRKSSADMVFIATWATNKVTTPTGGALQTGVFNSMDFTADMALEFQVFQDAANEVSIEIITIKHIKN
jgi:hypothetical protein